MEDRQVVRRVDIVAVVSEVSVRERIVIVGGVIEEEVAKVQCMEEGGEEVVSTHTEDTG